MKLKDLTVGHYQLIAAAMKHPNHLKGWLEVLPTVTGKSSQHYAALPIDDFLAEIQSVKDALDEAHDPTPPHQFHFTHNGIRGIMRLTKSVELMTASQFIDASELSKTGEISDNLHLYLATFYTCQNLTIRERAEIIKDQMTLDIALSALAFFLECAITLHTALNLCLAAKPVTAEPKGRMRKRNGLGTWLSKAFSKAQVIIGRKLLTLAPRSS